MRSLLPNCVTIGMEVAKVCNCRRNGNLQTHSAGRSSWELWRQNWPAGSANVVREAACGR